MTCAVCKALRPVNPWITGIWTNYAGVPVAVAYRCVPPCTNNRNIPWGEATPEQRQQAYLARLSADTANETLRALA